MWARGWVCFSFRVPHCLTGTQQGLTSSGGVPPSLMGQKASISDPRPYVLKTTEW